MLFFLPGMNKKKLYVGIIFKPLNSHFHSGERTLAGSAPGCPKIKYNCFTLQDGQRNGIAVNILQLKRGCRLVYDLLCEVGPYFFDKLFIYLIYIFIKPGIASLYLCI